MTLSYVGHASRFDEVKIHGDLEKRDAAVSYRLGGKVVAVVTVNRDQTNLKVEAAMEKGDLDAIEAALSS